MSEPLTKSRLLSCARGGRPTPKEDTLGLLMLEHTDYLGQHDHLEAALHLPDGQLAVQAIRARQHEHLGALEA